MAQKNIELRVTELLKEKIEELGYELYDVEYIKEGKEYHLCIYIDKPDGIDISDCEKVNDVINLILDEEEYLQEQYFLEVSSSGLEKKLRKKEHYQKQIGKEIEITLYSKIDDKKNIRGILINCEEDSILLKVDNEEIKINFDKIASGKSIFNW